MSQSTEGAPVTGAPAAAPRATSAPVHRFLAASVRAGLAVATPRHLEPSR